MEWVEILAAPSSTFFECRDSRRGSSGGTARDLRIAFITEQLEAKAADREARAELLSSTMKPTQCLQKMLRRVPLSTKQAGREYYKGNRVGTMGTIDRYGRFHPDYSKIRTFVYPAKGTKGFEVRA